MPKYQAKHPRPNSRHPRPHLWITGPDPELRRRYYVWLQQRNQALYRDEGWDIDFDTWLKIWGDQWSLRGRTRGSYCMSRLDWSLPWTESNVAIVSRETHAKAQGLAKAAGWCSVAQQRRRGRTRQKEFDFASND